MSITLYHNTTNENAIKINKEGIIPGKRLYAYGKGSEAEGSGVWCSTVRGYGYGGATITFEINENDESLEKQNDTEYMVFRNIEPNEILDIDLQVSEVTSTGPHNTMESDIPAVINKHGRDKVLQVFKKYENKFIYPYNYELFLNLVETGEKYCKGSIKLKEDKDLTYQGNNMASGKATGKNITVDKMYSLIDELKSKYPNMITSQDDESLEQINKAKNNPDYNITIYRATPVDEINVGDWVFLCRSRAERWTKTFMGTPKPNFVVSTKTVKAKDVDWTGKNLEFVYKPSSLNENNKIVENKHKVEEASRNELLAKTKGETISRYKRAEGYKGFNIVSIDTSDLLKGNTLVVTCRVGKYDDVVQLEDVLYWIQICAEENSTNQINTKVITKALSNSIDGMDIKVDCECGDWIYRMAYQATEWGYKYGKPETRPAKITNPNGFGALCKHLTAMLSNKKWMQQVSGTVMDWCVKNIEQINEFVQPKEGKELTLPNELARQNAKVGFYTKLFKDKLEGESDEETELQNMDKQDNKTDSKNNINNDSTNDTTINNIEKDDFKELTDVENKEDDK